jgi:outer membrane protein assembly factor BamE
MGDPCGPGRRDTARLEFGDHSQPPGVLPLAACPGTVPMSRSVLSLQLVALPALLLAGCASPLQSTDGFLGAITPYRIDIVQGNVVTQEQLALLKPGMSRNQVRDVLGSPLLTDAFHADRWDYIFTIRRPGTDAKRRSVVVRFDGEAMKSVEAPELPSERDFVASISRNKAAKPPPLELSDEERKALPPPPKRDSPAAEPTGAVREYPPLEAS